MATYTAITDAEIDQDSPITQTLMTKYRDNLIATAERAAGAPRVNVCERTLIYNGGTVSTVESSDFEDGYFYRFIFDQVGQDGSNGAHDLAMDFMKQSDSAWVGLYPTSYLAVGNTGSSTTSTNGVVTVFAPRIAANHFSAYGFIDKVTAATVTFSTTGEQFQGGRVYVGATETKIKRVRFWMRDPVTGARNMLTGKIYQEKLNLDI